MSKAQIVSRTFLLLKDGNKHTNQEIGSKCDCSHPSAIIRYLRESFKVQDEWEVNKWGCRVKYYWIDPDDMKKEDAENEDAQSKTEYPQMILQFKDDNNGNNE